MGSELERAGTFGVWNKTPCKEVSHYRQKYRGIRQHVLLNDWAQMALSQGGSFLFLKTTTTKTVKMASGTVWCFSRSQLQQECKSWLEKQWKRVRYALFKQLLFINIFTLQVRISPIGPPGAPYMEDNVCNNAVSEVSRPFFLRFNMNFKLLPYYCVSDSSLDWTFRWSMR